MRIRIRVGESLILVLFIIIYRLSLDWVYKNIILQFFAYEKYYDFSTTMLTILSWLLLFSTIPLIYRIIKLCDLRISSIVVVFLYMISFVSYTSCVKYGIMQPRTIIFNFVYWIVLLLMQIYNMSKPVKEIVKVKIGDSRLEENIVMIIGIISILITLFISARYTHFRINLNIFTAYDLRAESREYNFSTVLRYLFFWTRAINPALFAYCIIKKKYGMAFIYFVTQLLNFSIDGLKSTLFLTFIYAAIGLFYKSKSKKNHKEWIVFVISGIGVASIVEFIILHSKYIVLFVTRRLSFATNQLNEFYVDFFSKNTPDYFRGSFLRFIGFKTPYENLSMLIGNTYFGTNQNCNNGLLSDAVTNFGVLGIIIAPIFIIVFLHFFDRCIDGLDLRIVLCVGIYLSSLLLSSFLPTVLITHGALVLMILLSKLRRENNNESITYQ